MKILKFGGSSVAKPERIRLIVSILKSYYKRGEKFAVVFSAFGGITDTLIEMSNKAAQGDESYKIVLNACCERHIAAAKELLTGDILETAITDLEQNHKVLSNLLHGVFLVKEASPRTLDHVLSFGERNSAYIIAQTLKENGVNASYLDARRIIKTDISFGSAKVDFKKTEDSIKEHFKSHPELQIITGFISESLEGFTTTLGRGGSDYTASILGAALNAEQIEIWTDVNGVLTADPRKVKDAFTINDMTYAEAMEMSHFGAKVIYPPTLLPAMKKEIPIYIKNTFEPSFRGTYISANKPKSNGNPVKGITSISHVALLTLEGSGMFGVPGIAGRLFSCLAHASINIILITQGSSEHSISFCIQPKMVELAILQINQEFEYEIKSDYINAVKVEQELSVVAIVGERMRSHSGIASKLFNALGVQNINIRAIAQGSSELNVSIVVKNKHERKSLNAIHNSFFKKDLKPVHLYIVGVGLIGSTFLKQVSNQINYLKDNLDINFKVVGIANSRKMLIGDSEIDLENWKTQLEKSETKMNIGEFVSQIKSNNYRNSIFIDNTANDTIPNFYEELLEHRVSISTPNKVAASSSYIQYNRLNNLAKKRKVFFKYETNVGAGLPIISTLKDLVNSGDEILKIEAVLSGSLSYIFNKYSGKISFSEIVKEAKELGYTEPDPRIDLNGVDVRRKIIILAREIGLPMESDDVKIDNILPKSCQEAKTVDDFFKQLDHHNSTFNQLVLEAEKAEKKLRYIGQIEKGKARIKLISIDSEHPFYGLGGSDNMIVITTKRYSDRPLVIKGPGAGAEVTAAGVFAEVISIGNLLCQ